MVSVPSTCKCHHAMGASPLWFMCESSLSMPTAPSTCACTQSNSSCPGFAPKPLHASSSSLVVEERTCAKRALKEAVRKRQEERTNLVWPVPLLVPVMPETLTATNPRWPQREEVLAFGYVLGREGGKIGGGGIK